MYSNWIPQYLCGVGRLKISAVESTVPTLGVIQAISPLTLSHMKRFRQQLLHFVLKRMFIFFILTIQQKKQEEQLLLYQENIQVESSNAFSYFKS